MADETDILTAEITNRFSSFYCNTIEKDWKFNKNNLIDFYSNVTINAVAIYRFA